MWPASTCALLLCAAFCCFQSSAVAVRGLPGKKTHRGVRKHSRSGSQLTPGAMKDMFPWYHTTDELLQEAERISLDCNGRMSLRVVNSSGVDIHVARVRSNNAKPLNRVFMLFGEHSRELISPESGLQLLKVLCGQDASSSERVASLLQDNEFELVLNGNPRSRRQVEGGDFCLRMNPNGVDLNRNWDEEWQKDPVAHSDTNPGASPFSEPETQIFKELVTQFKPTTFMTVHSGTKGMYMPWAYDMEHLASRNQASMMEILKEVDAKHCECPYGAAGREVGYSCPGTCLDYVYDKLQTPYSFAFEIYVDHAADEMLKQRWEDKMQSGGSALLQSGSHLAHAHFLDFFHKHSSDFVQTAKKARMSSKEDSCFANFNPTTQDDYNETVQNWAIAYVEVAEQVTSRLRKDSN